MRIGIDARMYGAESTTGIGVYIENLVNQLFKIDSRNEYFLLLTQEAFSKFNPPNSRIKKIKVDCRWYSWSEQIQLPRILKKLNLDLVHFPHFNVPIFYRGDYVVSIHDITPKFFPGPRVKSSFIRQLGYQLVFRRGIKKAKKILTVSEHTKNNLIKYFSVDAGKIKVTYPGVDEKFKPVESEELIEEIELKNKITKPFIFYVGVWRDHKNLPGLVKAFEILKSEYHLDYQLVLAGRPDSRYPEIQQAINHCPFKDDIVLPGFVSEKDLPIFYSAAELFVLPSFCEGFGLVAVESLACGTPVAGSNTTSLPEVLADAAVYFDPYIPAAIAQAINSVLTNPDFYQQLVKKGKSLTQKYSWLTCAQTTLAIYQSIV